MCFSLFCRLMRRENGLYLGPMMRHLQKSNTVLLSARNQQRGQRVGLKRLPGERQEFSNVPPLPYDQIWIYSPPTRSRNHQQILPQEPFLLPPRVHLGGEISDNCGAVMG